jgi:hypothetical protein
MGDLSVQNVQRDVHFGDLVSQPGAVTLKLLDEAVVAVRTVTQSACEPLEVGDPKPARRRQTRSGAQATSRSV